MPKGINSISFKFDATDTGHVNLDFITLENVTPPAPTPIPPKVLMSFSYAYLYGYSDGRAAADQSLKREEVSATLYRLLKQTGKTAGFVKPATSDFSDIETNRWSYNAIEYMVRIGAISISKKVYPQAPITRGETAKLIAISMNLKYSIDETKKFSDLDSSNQYYEYMMDLINAGLMQGYPDGSAHPDGILTRAEYVTIINRMIGRDETYNVDSVKNQYPDLSADHWAFKEIQRASYGFSDSVDANGYYNIDPTKKLPREQIDLN